MHLCIVAGFSAASLLSIWNWSNWVPLLAHRSAEAASSAVKLRPGYSGTEKFTSCRRHADR